MIRPYLRIGLIVRPHGVKGAVKLDPATDDTARFKGLTSAFLELHGQYVPVRLSVVSAQPSSVIVHIEGCDTPEDAQKLRNVFLCVSRENAVALEEKTWFVTDLIGMEVVDTEGRHYGKITDVYETGANDVYEIEKGALMIPALKKLIVSADIQTGVMTVEAEVLRETGLFQDSPEVRGE